MDDESLSTHHGTMQRLHRLPRLIALFHFAIADDERGMIWWGQTNRLNCSELAEQGTQRLSGEGWWQSIQDDGTLHENASLQQDIRMMQRVEGRTSLPYPALWSEPPPV
jgi:hypothetical protein